MGNGRTALRPEATSCKITQGQPSGDNSRAALATSHLKLLREIARVPTGVHTGILLHELGQRPLGHLWWRRALRFWNTLAGLHDGDLFRQVAVDACRDAVVHDVHNWAWALIRGLRAIGYEYTIRCDILIPVDIASVCSVVCQAYTIATACFADAASQCSLHAHVAAL